MTVDQVPEYEAATKLFIAPHLLKEGQRFKYSGIPGAAYVPLNEAAEAAVAARLKEKPNAFLNPINQLPIVDGAGGPEQAEVPTFELGAFVQPAAEEVDLGSLGNPGKAKPGLSDGGKVPAARAKGA